MKGRNQWGYRPYRPAAGVNSDIPYICRLAPYETLCEIQWLGEGESFLISYAERGSGNWCVRNVNGREARLNGLKPDQEYEVTVTDEKGRASNIRLLRTGSVPGVVVNYLHPEDEQYSFSGRYLCSPSILKLPQGALLASMDVYGPAMPQNLTLLFRSEDGGAHWSYVTDLFPCFWGKLFWHGDRLYMLGISNEYGDILIGCSLDEGTSWSRPEVILRGSAATEEFGNHRAPMTVIKSHNRLWTGTEYGTWRKRKFYDSLLSIDEDADLMDCGNWTLTDFVDVDQTWPGAQKQYAGAIEGNAVETPEGDVADILRYGENQALMLKADPKNPEKPMEFVKFLDFPLGHTKFELQRHANGYYYAMGNPFPGRTTLALYVSKDLEHWEKAEDIISHPECDITAVGFQYPAFVFDKDEILLLSRTAWNCPHSYHDSNYITFHKIELP